VSFTWNLKTVENPDGVTDLLTHNLDRVSPSDFELSEPAANTEDGVTEAWFTFTTSVGRGQGTRPPHRRRRHQGMDRAHLAAGDHRSRRAARAPTSQGRGARRRSRTEELVGETRRGGRRLGQDRRPVHPRRRRGTGRNRARRSPPPARRSRPRRRPVGAARRPVALTVQVAVPARSRLVRPSALSEIPGQLAGVRTQGQDRRLAGVLYEGDGDSVLVIDDGHLGEL
jgi:hypothetical protein